ncbi:hypothetical protein Tco_1158832, partial [Tanacetum coccineum]
MMWEKLAKACGRRASADQIQGTHPESYFRYLRKAAGMENLYGKCESLMQQRAVLCVFTRRMLFEAAEAYAQRSISSPNCIELEEVEQQFLESCALNYHEHKDSNSMLKFVRAFCSMESKRTFLRSLGCLDEIRACWKRIGSRSLGLLLLWHVFFYSIWGTEIEVVKQFAQKEELCNKVKLLAKMDSDVMYDFVCSELKILSDQHNSLPELKKDLYVSQNNRSLRGEILSIRKILDKHLHLKSSKYDWEDELPLDIYKHCKDKMFQNRVSVITLAFYWSLWKKHILDILKSIESLENEEPFKASGHADFCLYYFGVRKLCEKGNMVYLSLNKDADWIRNTGNKGFRRDEKR